MSNLVLRETPQEVGYYEDENKNMFMVTSYNDKTYLVLNNVEEENILSTDVVFHEPQILGMCYQYKTASGEEKELTLKSTPISISF